MWRYLVKQNKETMLIIPNSLLSLAYQLTTAKLKTRASGACGRMVAYYWYELPHSLVQAKNDT